MKTALFLAAALLLAVTGTLGGRITPWADADLYYPNSGRVQYMNLYFQLDNRLPAGHVLRVSLPFTTTLALNTSSTASTSTVYLASSFSKGTYSSTAAASLNVAATPTNVKLSSSAPYTAYFTLSAELAASTPYVLKLVFGTSPSDSAGFIGWVQMETMSPAQSVATSNSASDTPITYDMNNAFAPIQLFAAPGSNTTFTVTSDANSTAAGASVLRQFAIVPSANFFYWPTIQISWDNSNFTISNLVSHDSGVNATTATPLATGTGPNQYSYTQSGTVLSIFHNAPLFTTQTVKYNITTQNPSSTTQQPIVFTLRIFHRFNLNLTDHINATAITVVAQTGGSVQSTSPQITGYQLLLSWGVDPQAQYFTSTNTNLAKVFTLYASATTNKIFQAVRWVFGTNGTWTTGTYQVAITICATQTNCDILENSIVSGNMTAASCIYNWPATTSAARQIVCNTTGLATAGNTIGARIWLLGGASTTFLTTPAGTNSTFADNTFGKIDISIYTQSSNTFTSVTSSNIASAYGYVNYNAAPLVNINGNGPLAGIPATSTLATLDTATFANYGVMWTNTGTEAIASSDTQTKFISYAGPAVSTATTTPVAPVSSAFGGIFATTTAGMKYHLALFTSATMLPASGTTNAFGGTVVSGTPVTTATLPGIDIFINPNLFTNGGSSSSGNSAISSCWAGNVPNKPAATVSWTSSTTPGDTLIALHCFTNNNVNSNANFLRLRALATHTDLTKLNIGGTSKIPSIDSNLVAASNTVYMSFFWETAVTMTTAWSGASLRADSLVGDYYGVLYTYTPASSITTWPIRTGTGGVSPTDLGELSTNILSNNFTLAIGTPFFWTQMIMGPWGSSKTGAHADAHSAYFSRKSVFVSGYAAFNSAPGDPEALLYNSASLVQTIRIRGTLNTATGGSDVGLYPTGGSTSNPAKIALFIATLNGGKVFEPLGGVSFTNLKGEVGKYNDDTAKAPLVGNGAVRCWSSGQIGNCQHERYARELPTPLFTTSGSSGVAGPVSPLDYYQIITSDAPFASGYFSINILTKPILGVVATLQSNYYRFGFSFNGTYWIQSWDQFFDNGASTDATTGAVTKIGQGFSAFGASPTIQFPASGTACTLPYTSGGTTPGIRFAANTGDVDNSLATANVTLAVQQGIASTTALTASSLQGSAVWCVRWNFKQNTNFNVSSSALENTAVGDRCFGFDFLTASYATPVAFYCVYCPWANSATQFPGTSGQNVSATMSNFFDGPATNIYNTVFTNFIGDNGRLVEMSNCPTLTKSDNIWVPQTMTVTGPTTYYAISGQKLSIPFTAPSGITTSMVDTITLIGRQNNTSTSDPLFPYGAFDNAAVCKLAPTATISNYDTYVDCAASVVSNNIVINSIGSITSSAITQWTLIVWGFNGNSAQPNTTTFFYIQTYKSSNTYIVDQSNNGTTSYAQWSLANGTSALSTSNSAYQRPYYGARGWFRFDITFTQRTWFYTDKVVMSLDGVATLNQNANASVVKCRITDQSDAINYGFQSCTYSPGATPTLTIIAQKASGTTYPADFSTGSGIRVYLDNMVTIAPQTNKTVYGSVTFVGAGTSGNPVLSKVANSTMNDFTSVNLTTVTFPTGYPTVTKWWYSANEFQDINFGLITSAPLNSTCRITIVFPSYYNPGLTTRSATPYCTINNIVTQCLVGDVTTSGVVTLSKGQRQLVIYGFSGSISNNTAFTVRVNGIPAPVANYTAETFWIQINGDNNNLESQSTIIYAGTVTDPSYVTQSTSIFPLNVVWFGVGATATRSTTTFTWSFGLNNNTATVATTSAIQAIFPENWGLAWGEFAPTCQIVDFTSNITTYSAAISASTGNNSIFGNLVNMNISTAIPAGAVVNLTCSGVRTPGLDGYYRSQDVQIRVVDANGTFTYLRSAPGQHNVNFTYYFAKGSSQTYVSWADASNSSSPLALTAGTYNLKVTATVPSKATRSFTITPSNTQFAFLSSTAPFWIVTGATSNSTNLGCAQTVPVGVYALYFSVSDNSSTYVAPPVMWVNVNNNAQVITPSATTLSTYFQSASVVSTTAPLVFDLTNYPPYSDITITPNITVSGNTNFTFTPASIRLTAAAPKAYFTFSSTATASATGSAVYNFAITGTNAAAYSIAQPVTVNLQSDSGSGAVNTPVLTVAADTTTDTFSPTAKPLLFTLTQVTQATVYWVVTLQGQSITDINTIVTNAAALTQYSAQSANQAQYFTNFLVASARNSLTVSNLWPNTGYTVSAVAVSQTSKNSTVATFSFATGVNGAPVQRWLFNYTTYPVLSVRQSLLCTITQTLAVPANNVRDVNGEICGNSTSFYGNQNSTGDLAIYFYPLQASADTTMTATNLNAVLNATDAVRQAFNGSLNNIASNTGFLNIWSDYAYIPRQAPNLTIPTTIAATSLTTSSINLALASINETGFLFVALCSNTSTAPTAVQMKQAAANISSITGLVSLQVIYYYPGAVPSYNFTGLSIATSYNLYVAAGNNDPSFLQNFTAVTTIPVTTASTNSGSSASQIGVILSVMTVFASVISLMFF